MTFKYRYRKQILIAILAILVLTGGGTCLFLSLKAEPVEAKEVLKVSKKEPQQEKEEDKKVETYKVDIKGEVVNPGIYSLSKDSRVIDVINEAGGLKEYADTSVINLSKKITDEMVIIVYSYEQVQDFKRTKEEEQTVQENCLKGGEYELPNDACIKENQEDTNNDSQVGPININTATKEELMTLSGIGESKAIAIITYREKNGPFEKIDDLKNVTGIGESIFAKIKENITT